MINIRKAERRQSKLRLGLAGPSGAGKTMSALKLARGMMPEGKILLIDTERGSGDLYAHLYDYDILQLTPPYAPKNYVEAIAAGIDAKYDVIIIDSLTHAWADEGGLLDQADKLGAAKGNRYTIWADLTPQHRSLVNAMLNAPCHIIATVRSKQSYEMEEYTDSRGNKKTKPVKLGMAPVQREGMEYEFTVFMDIEINHSATTSKDRTDLFKDEVFVIDEKIGERLMTWLNSGKTRQEFEAEEAERQRQAILAEKKQQLAKLLKSMGYELTTADEYRAKVKELTQLDLTDGTIDEIADRLLVIANEAAKSKS